ncbi:N-acetyltransferase [Streptomyces sp. SCUT-3]|uniref:N-acetyltransferase n=1 Tax=Streptomyces sp. SCUT-3 TaxID=2684469 RepID=UPI000CBB8500|nr:N-acetyltransferase [Streptomyces sp. SCUT-3]PLW71250.1 N-acetyltransferase [Streptomyces sp. DJ]QMV24717.1 N-acetyltransferase [Streptomyces sp. SCUT-3]
MDVTFSTLAERPELAASLWFPDTWPEFVLNDLVGWAHFGRVAATFPEFTVVGTDGDGEVVVRGHSAPFALAAPGRGALPAGGWDQVLLWAFSDHRRGVLPDTVSALEVAVRSDRLGRGLSAAALDALRESVRARGFRELVAPVRPTGKHREPATPMAEYAWRTREDGLPADPWLRTHVRAGGVIASVAPASMTVAGSLAQWREWTGLPFDEEGPVEVPGGLVPVRCEPRHDHAVYVEPNVWVRHVLAPEPRGAREGDADVAHRAT